MIYKPSEFPGEKLPPTIFNMIEVEIDRRAAKGQKIIGLHVGDASLNLPRQLKTAIPDEEKSFGNYLNRYGDTFGEKPLRELLLEKVKAFNRLSVSDIDSIQITSGATGALQAGFSRLLSPGAEILTLAPYWSILRQVADQANVNLVEVPFWDRLQTGNSDFDLNSHLAKYITDKTEAIYLNTPSNPTGMVLEDIALEQLRDFAGNRDIWVFSDEAYEDFIYDGSKHRSVGSLNGMAERTVSIYTFSKCLGSSGLRVGYAVAPPAVIAEMNWGVVGGYYQTGRLDQLMAWRGMQSKADIVGEFMTVYRKSWDFVRNNLKAEFMPSVAGFYFFMRTPGKWQNLSAREKVEKMLDLGVVLSPGEYFGEEYRDWLRFCFTIAPFEEIQESVEILNSLY